nr:MAG TPA: hypothetical protein [Caudoviricetes sp.]
MQFPACVFAIPMARIFVLAKSSFPLIADRLLRRLTTAVRVLAVHP